MNSRLLQAATCNWWPLASGSRRVHWLSKWPSELSAHKPDGSRALLLLLLALLVFALWPASFFVAADGSINTSAGASNHLNVWTTTLNAAQVAREENNGVVSPIGQRRVGQPVAHKTSQLMERATYEAEWAGRASGDSEENNENDSDDYNDYGAYVLYQDQSEPAHSPASGQSASPAKERQAAFQLVFFAATPPPASGLQSISSSKTAPKRLDENENDDEQVSSSCSSPKPEELAEFHSVRKLPPENGSMRLVRRQQQQQSERDDDTDAGGDLEADDIKWLDRMSGKAISSGPNDEQPERSATLESSSSADKQLPALKYSARPNQDFNRREELVAGSSQLGDGQTNDNYPLVLVGANSPENEWAQLEPVMGPKGNLSLANSEVAKRMEEEESQRHNVYYWRLIWFILPIGATFGNLLVIMAVYMERSLQSVTNYFIVSLAFADLFVGLIVMPFAVYVLVNEIWELGDAICDIYVAVDVTSSTASILNLVAISIDRYRAIAHPIAYSARSSSTRAILTIFLVWLISCCVGAPIILGLNTSPERKSSLCIFYNSTFIFWSSLTSFYVPCIIMIGLYWRIFLAIRSRTKKAIQAGNHRVAGPSGKKQSNQTANANTITASCPPLPPIVPPVLALSGSETTGELKVAKTTASIRLASPSDADTCERRSITTASSEKQAQTNQIATQPAGGALLEASAGQASRDKKVSSVQEALQSVRLRRQMVGEQEVGVGAEMGQEGEKRVELELEMGWNCGFCSREQSDAAPPDLDGTRGKGRDQLAKVDCPSRLIGKIIEWSRSVANAATNAPLPLQRGPKIGLAHTCLALFLVQISRQLEGQTDQSGATTRDSHNSGSPVPTDRKRRIFMNANEIAIGNSDDDELATTTTANGRSKQEMDSAKLATTLSYVQFRCDFNEHLASATSKQQVPLPSFHTSCKSDRSESEGGANSRVSYNLATLLSRLDRLGYSELLLTSECQVNFVERGGRTSWSKRETLAQEQEEATATCLCCKQTIEKADEVKQSARRKCISICLIEPLMIAQRCSSSDSRQRNGDCSRREQVTVITNLGEGNVTTSAEFICLNVGRNNKGNLEENDNNKSMKRVLIWTSNGSSPNKKKLSELDKKSGRLEVKCRRAQNSSCALRLCANCSASCLLSSTLELPSNGGVNLFATRPLEIPQRNSIATSLLERQRSITSGTRWLNRASKSVHRKSDVECSNLSRLIREEQASKGGLLDLEASKQQPHSYGGHLSASEDEDRSDDEDSLASTSSEQHSSQQTSPSSTPTSASGSIGVAGRHFHRDGCSISSAAYDCSARFRSSRNSSRRSCCQRSPTCTNCDRCLFSSCTTDNQQATTTMLTNQELAEFQLDPSAACRMRRSSSMSTELKSGEISESWRPSVAGEVTTMCHCSATVVNPSECSPTLANTHTCRQSALANQEATPTGAHRLRDSGAALSVYAPAAIVHNSIRRLTKAPKTTNEPQSVIGSARAQLKRRSLRLSQLIRGRRATRTEVERADAKMDSQQGDETRVNSDETEDKFSGIANTTNQRSTFATSTSFQQTSVNLEAPLQQLSSGSLTDNKRIPDYDLAQLSVQDTTNQRRSDITSEIPEGGSDEKTKSNGKQSPYLVSTVVNLMQQQQKQPKKKSPIIIPPSSNTVTQGNQSAASRRRQGGSRRRREKNASRRERKATKTLAIVLGIFLICWTPFFTCNIIDGVCIQLNMDCRPGMMVYLVTSWLGYINSCVNPIIYTIFNMEFRRAFKKILTTSPGCCCGD